MKSISNEKYERLVEFLQDNKVNALLIADFEENRNINLRYLTGQPSDGLVLILDNGESHLIPWDLSIAKQHAEADEIYDIANYEYNFYMIIIEILKKKFGDSGLLIGVGDNFPYGSFMKMKALMPNLNFFEEPPKIELKLDELRATKTEL